MNVTITFANKVESYYTRADGSAALSKDVLELNADGSAAVLWSRLEFDRGGGDDGTRERTAARLIHSRERGAGAGKEFEFEGTPCIHAAI